MEALVAVLSFSILWVLEPPQGRRSPFNLIIGKVHIHHWMYLLPLSYILWKYTEHRWLAAACLGAAASDLRYTDAWSLSAKRS